MNPLQEMLVVDGRPLNEVGYSFHFWDALMAAEPVLSSPQFQYLFSREIQQKDFRSTFDLYNKMK